MRLKIVLQALLWVPLTAGPFLNGSFETPIASGNTDLSFLTVTPWVYTGPGNSTFLVTSGQFGIAAGAGNQYLTFGGSGTTGGQISQTFDTTIGLVYTVTYLLASQQGGNTPPVQSMTVAAFNGATQLAIVSNSFNTAAGIWTAGNVLSFVAAGSSTTLRFTDTSVAADAANLALDNISVDAQAPSSVPEPSTYALVGVTLGWLAFGRKR